MILLALGQLRRRPAAFAGLAAALFLALATLTLFGSLFAADLTTPAVDRETADGPGLMVIAGAFGEIAVLVAFFVVVNALGFALRRQHRELALLRTIAATPRQVRRLVRGQVTATTLAMAVPAWAAGAASGRGMLAELQRRGMAAPGVRVPGTPVPMLVALAVTLAVGLAASAVAARRITRTAPAAALTASSTEHSRTGAPRLLAAAAVLTCGGFLLRPAATRPAGQVDKAGQAALLGSLVLLVATALAGPFAARVLAAVLGTPIRVLAPGAGWLADANLRGYARRLSSAVVPVALLVGLSGTMLIMTSTAASGCPPRPHRADAHPPRRSAPPPSPRWPPPRTRVRRATRPCRPGGRRSPRPAPRAGAGGSPAPLPPARTARPPRPRRRTGSRSSSHYLTRSSPGRGGTLSPRSDAVPGVSAPDDVPTPPQGRMWAYGGA